MTTTVYGSSTVKRRRRTTDELAVLDEAIVAAVADEHPVTLRGVFYRAVSAGAIEKTELGYRTVGRRLLALRRDDRVPYSWITDGTRWIRKPASHRDLDQMLDTAAASYRRALWNDQPVEVMFFTEKDAISGVVYPITARWDVPLGVLRGYCSESFAYTVADDIRRAIAADRYVYVYQLGDHDPSGIDAWRDFREKVVGFLGVDADTAGMLARFVRLAVTPAQIDSYSLPTRPTKAKDPRAAGHVGGSVEVDAIPANILRGLVDSAITQHIDPEALRLTQIAEQSEREILLAMRGGQ